MAPTRRTLKASLLLTSSTIIRYDATANAEHRGARLHRSDQPLAMMLNMQTDDTGARVSSGTPLFTVFTATYNRAHTIHRVFNSLSAQTLRDFEWIVVDDGSTDNTAELIAAWTEIADFPIRYVKQEHSGKHVARNRAVREARGRFFALIDSDDALVPNALERIVSIWNTIPLETQSSFCGVVGLCRNQYGDIIGDRFPSSPFDSRLADRKYVHRIRGEKWGSSLTEIERKFLFPEIRGTQFVPEGAVHLELERHYKNRAVNEVFRIYYVDDAETGTTLTKRMSLGDNASGRLFYYVYLLNNHLEYFFRSPMPFLKAAAMLPIAAWFSGQSFRSTLKSIQKPMARALVLLALPFAFLLYASDRMIGVVRSKAKNVVKSSRAKVQ
jgi:glycosyltransferase involved in cell wall biosynthesis